MQLKSNEYEKIPLLLEPDNLVIYFPLYEIAPIQVEFHSIYVAKRLFKAFLSKYFD